MPAITCVNETIRQRMSFKSALATTTNVPFSLSFSLIVSVKFKIFVLMAFPLVIVIFVFRANIKQKGPQNLFHQLGFGNVSSTAELSQSRNFFYNMSKVQGLREGINTGSETKLAADR